MPQMKFDFDGLIQLLAHNLYSEKHVFIRELVQNAHDGVLRRQDQEPALAGRISIETRPADLQFSVQDNGIGMNDAEILEYLSTIGLSRTRLEKGEGGIKGLIGQFGIGFLSAFMVASKVEVRTRKVGETKGYMWVNHGSHHYEIKPCEVAEPGTTVTVFLRGAEERGLIHEEEVRKTVRRYADMLKVPIYLNASNEPINKQIMPWEDASFDTPEERTFQCHLYLETSQRDSVMEVIPFDLPALSANGVLYITRSRLWHLDAPRDVRLFLNRMFVSGAIPEILPKWATFVNGIINSGGLMPTAARDNVVRDSDFDALRDALGNRVAEYLRDLRQKDPKRFREILLFHDHRIKAACDYYEPMFKMFVDMLEWEVNSEEVDPETGDLKPSWLSLPEIVGRLEPEKPSGMKTVRCFSATGAANQFFGIYNSHKMLVVDASGPFELQLLEQYVKQPGTKLQLLHVDRQDDPAVFRQIRGGAAQEVVRLAEAMSKKIVRKDLRSNLKVEAREFEPVTLAGVIREGEYSTAIKRAYQMISNPQSPTADREVAQELIKRFRNQSEKLTINARNPMIQRLARQDYDDDEVMQLMAGVFNNAILNSAMLLTPTMARFLAEHFSQFMDRSLRYLERRADLERQEKELAANTRRSAAAGQLTEFTTFLLLVPPGATHNLFADGVRTLVEDRWGCRLCTADLHGPERRLDMLRDRLDASDAILAETTQADPHILFELGAVFADRRGRPVLQFINGHVTGTAPTLLPVELGSGARIDYGDRRGEELVNFLERALRQEPRVAGLLDEKGRKQFLGARKVREAVKLPLSEDTYDRLAARFPTRERWLSAEEAELEALLPPEVRDMAPVVLARARKAWSVGAS
jgi:molecular chaperone HtpG